MGTTTEAAHEERHRLDRCSTRHRTFRRAPLELRAAGAPTGYDKGPPRSRAPGNGPSWQEEPGDCQSIWRRSHYRGTDPDPFIRLQLMRYRHPSKKERRAGRN